MWSASKSSAKTLASPWTGAPAGELLLSGIEQLVTDFLGLENWLAFYCKKRIPKLEATMLSLVKFLEHLNVNFAEGLRQGDDSMLALALEIKAERSASWGYELEDYDQAAASNIRIYHSLKDRIVPVSAGIEMYRRIGCGTECAKDEAELRTLGKEKIAVGGICLLPPHSFWPLIEGHLIMKESWGSILYDEIARDFPCDLHTRVEVEVGLIKLN
jgi:hypothetical protein